MVQTISDLGMLAEIIRLLPDSSHPNVILVSGFAGSGKTTLARQLVSMLDDAVIIPIDDFITPDYTERSDEWDCVDRQRVIDEVLRPAESGMEIIYKAFDWDANRPVELKNVGKPHYIILEGIGIIHPSTLPYADFSIWIDCSPETAMRRGINRDAAVLHDDHAKLWRDVWAPNDAEYFERHHPDELSDCKYDSEITDPRAEAAVQG